jgi:5-(carboxyamino)imidazole ribonucleotide synthase
VRVGILGGGQLARMLALSGHPLGASFVTLDPAPDACAAAVSSHLIGGYGDPAKLEELAARSDVITYEFENVPAESVKFLAEKNIPVYPSTQALAVSRDRLKEKSLFKELGIPAPAFAAVGSLEELRQAVEDIGLPAVLKTCTLGYDGKGQAVIRSGDDIDSAWARVGGTSSRMNIDNARAGGILSPNTNAPADQSVSIRPNLGDDIDSRPCILESFVPFTREISVIAVRSRDGQVAFYPVSQNTHSDGILRHAICMIDDPMQSLAEGYVKRILNHFNYVGALALELFDAGGTLLANEIAPRVHNTGHWTIEGAETSQFENHIRAVIGLPLGGTSAICPCAMVNFIGRIPPAEKVLSIKGAHFHDYGKAPKPGRKRGHATVCGDNADDVMDGLEELVKLAEAG